MLMRSDPFRDLDRFTQQVMGTAARPTVMPMDAWREGEEFVVEFDLPGIAEDSLDLDVERNVVTVRAERPDVDPGRGEGQTTQDPDRPQQRTPGDQRLTGGPPRPLNLQPCPDDGGPVHG